MKLFPKNLTIDLGQTGHDTRIYDSETREPLVYVTDLCISAGVDEVTKLSVGVMAYRGLSISVNGEATYKVDEDTLRRVAADNGFDIRRKPDGKRWWSRLWTWLDNEIWE